MNLNQGYEMHAERTGTKQTEFTEPEREQQDQSASIMPRQQQKRKSKKERYPIHPYPTAAATRGATAKTAAKRRDDDERTLDAQYAKAARSSGR
ncbi:hypothetical protein A0H81_03565 [Grifola frondosa]|uniref:Uncharacterized protein n=1 Tax=Grifola frondosa TaxID=5627 RepID=A0A1C7MQ35_GRIFR|nr:hypothetical protein A0H81_03565 [Grifola frondosa]